MATARKTPASEQHKVILLAGAEEFLIRRELERLIHERVTEESRGFDYSEFRSNEVNAGDLWNTLITMPFLAEQRVVILHMQGEPKEDLLRTLNRYSAAPSPTTVLIIVQFFEDRGMPMKLEGNVQTLTFPIQSAAKRAQWVQDYARQAGKELSSDAAVYLVSISSSRLADLAAKLEHAILYSGDQREITGKALMQISGVTSEFLPWDLEDAILERHMLKIFERARAMETGGEELLRLLAYQRNSLMLLWQVGTALRPSAKPKQDAAAQQSVKDEVSRILAKKTWKSKQYMDAYRAIGEVRLRASVVDLLDLEIRFKIGRAGWRDYYEWIWKLVRPSRTTELPMKGRS